MVLAGLISGKRERAVSGCVDGQSFAGSIENIG